MHHNIQESTSNASYFVLYKDKGTKIKIFSSFFLTHLLNLGFMSMYKCLTH